MYVLLLFLIVLVVPLPIMLRTAGKGASPYRAIFEGIVAVGVGAMLVFILASVAGHPVGDELKTVFNAAAEVLANNQSLTGVLKIADLDYRERVAALNQVYNYAVYTFPATIVVWAMVVSYFEYMFAAWLINKKQPKIKALPAFKEFCLPRNALIGAAIIFVLSWLVTVMGLVPRETLYVNVNLLFEFVFSVQGAAVVFFFCYSKKIPKAVAVILTIIFLSTALGKMLLFLLGITDLAFRLRARAIQKLWK